MDKAKQHWPILRELGTDFGNKVQEFLVVGEKGKGLIVATEDGLGYWIGEMQFESGESRTATKPTFLDVSGLVSMTQGNNYILLLNKRGEIYSMGKNDQGQLGLGSVDPETHFSPQLIPIPHKFISVRCGEGHSLALTDDGKVWAWGVNNYGQVGVPSSTDSTVPSPHQITKLNQHRVVAVECGGWHSLALTNEGEVYAWGCNDDGQFGNGRSSSQHILTQINPPSSVTSMAAGQRHTLLLTQTGEVYECRKKENIHSHSHIYISGYNIYSYLSKIAGLPYILQIASHPFTGNSIAMSPDHRCFIWDQLTNGTSITTPRELHQYFSTVESPFSSFSCHRSTPHSVTLPARKCSSRTDSAKRTKSCPRKTDSTTQTESRQDFVPNQPPPYQILDQMFNNSDSNPDVQFQVEDQTILAHRNVLKISSAHFRQLFSSSTADLNPTSSVTPQSNATNSQHTTNPAEPDTTPHFNQVTIHILDHSYPAFHAYLRFIYLGIIEVSPEHLADLFSLSVAYLEFDLQQFCISHMRTTLSPATCCLYYQLTLRHSLPELEDFRQEVVQFISTKFLEVIRTSAYQSMDDGLCKKLITSMANLNIN